MRPTLLRFLLGEGHDKGARQCAPWYGVPASACVAIAIAEGLEVGHPLEIHIRPCVRHARRTGVHLIVIGMWFLEKKL